MIRYPLHLHFPTNLKDVLQTDNLNCHGVFKTEIIVSIQIDKLLIFLCFSHKWKQHLSKKGKIKWYLIFNIASACQIDFRFVSFFLTKHKTFHQSRKLKTNIYDFTQVSALIDMFCKINRCYMFFFTNTIKVTLIFFLW